MEIDMSALRMVEAERGISLDTLVTGIEAALLKAYHNAPGAIADARVEIDRASGRVSVMAKEVDEDGTVIGEFDDTPSGFGHVATTTARAFILQRLREAEDAKVLGSFRDKQGTVVSGVVQQGGDPRSIFVKLADFEARIPEAEQVPGESFRHGDWIRAYVVKVQRSDFGVRIDLSRTHPELVRGLFTREVPEISSGEVAIEAIAREAGYRTKIAVRATRDGVRAKGCCIGPMGRRVRNVMNELQGEKIDIIEYSDDLATYVANALSPAHVSSVTVEDAPIPQVTAIVPDFELSLAIGREGQNARLAARLTGCKIDIQPDSVDSVASEDE